MLTQPPTDPRQLRPRHTGMPKTCTHTAALVLLEVNGALGEEHCSACFEGVEHEAGAVLCDHPAREGAVHDVEHLSRTRVSVGRVHAARAKETDRHGHG